MKRYPRIPPCHSAFRHIDTLEVIVARVRLAVDVDPELRRRIRMAAASRDQSVKQWLEDVLADALESEKSRAWMDSDLSRLGEVEPYE